MRTVNQPLTVPTAEVDLDAIGHNVRILREHAGSAQVMAVVKADGYGHGAVEAGRAALGAGAESDLARGGLALAEAITRTGLGTWLGAWIGGVLHDLTDGYAAVMVLSVAALGLAAASLGSEAGARERLSRPKPRDPASPTPSSSAR